MSSNFASLTLYQTTKFEVDLIKSINFADNISKIAQMRISLFERVENTVGKGFFSHSIFQIFLL